jgi:hypothetical protein
MTVFSGEASRAIRMEGFSIQDAVIFVLSTAGWPTYCALKIYMSTKQPQPFVASEG